MTDAGGGRSGTDWITFTPDGKRAAVTLMGDMVQLIDVETAKKVRTIAPGGAATACVFSPDGKWMATGGYEVEDGRYFVRLWDVGTGKQVRQIPVVRFPSGNGMHRALAFSPDGTTLAGGGWGDARLHLWEAATGKELTAFPKLAATSAVSPLPPMAKRSPPPPTASTYSTRQPARNGFTSSGWRVGSRSARTARYSSAAVSGAIYRWDAASGRQLTAAAAQDGAVEQILVSVMAGKCSQPTTTAISTSGIRPAGNPRAASTEVSIGESWRAQIAGSAWTVRTDYGNSRIRLYDVRGGTGHQPGLAQ